MEKHYRFKAVVVGDGGVGKTTLIIRYSERRFRESYIPTIGVQFTVKETTYNDNAVEILLYDIAGQDEFRFLRESFYQGSDAAIIVFDVTDMLSFVSVKNWYEELRRFLGAIPIFLLGNKVDLTEKREVTQSTAQNLAANLGIQFFETSAKTGQNVSALFNSVITDVIEEKPKLTPLTPQIEKRTPDLYSIINELKNFIQNNGTVPNIIDSIKQFSNVLFQQNPYSPILREITQYRIEKLNNYPTEQMAPQDRELLITKIEQWEKNPIIL